MMKEKKRSILSVDQSLLSVHDRIGKKKIYFFTNPVRGIICIQNSEPFGANRVVKSASIINRPRKIHTFMLLSGKPLTVWLLHDRLKEFRQ